MWTRRRGKFWTGQRLDQYFVHSTGHGLGLEVHEDPRVATRAENSGWNRGTWSPLSRESMLRHRRHPHRRRCCGACRSDRSTDPHSAGSHRDLKTGMKRKKTSKQAPAEHGSTLRDPEFQQIEQLLQFMSEHNLEEFEYSRGDLRIRLRKPSTGRCCSRRRERICAGDYRGRGFAAEASSAQLLESASAALVQRRRAQRRFASDQIADCRDLLWRAEPGRRGFRESRRLRGKPGRRSASWKP